jgi:hypothetical protein
VLGATKGDLSFGYNGVVDFIVCLFLILFALVSKKVGGSLGVVGSLMMLY